MGAQRDRFGRLNVRVGTPTFNSLGRWLGALPVPHRHLIAGHRPGHHGRMRLLSIVVGVVSIADVASADADKCADLDPSGDFDLKLKHEPDPDIANGIPECAFAKGGVRVHYEVVADLASGYLRVSNLLASKKVKSVITATKPARSLTAECKRRGAAPRVIGVQWAETLWMNGKKYRVSGNAGVQPDGHKVVMLTMAEERRKNFYACYANLSNPD